MFAPSAPPPALPPQSEHRGRTQTANKTGIRRVSTHSGLQQKKFPDTPRLPPSPPLFFFLTNFFHCSFFSVAHSSLPPLYSTLPPCLFPPLAPTLESRLFHTAGGRLQKNKKMICFPTGSVCASLPL